MYPYFSIIVPTYNRPVQLSICLKSLVELKYQRDRFEVIVVDDGSKESLNSVVQPFSKEITVKLVSQFNAGPAAARNTGVKHAKGEYIAFTDDDCRPAHDWLQQLAFHFGTAKNHAIGGKTINALIRNLYSSASQLHVDYLYEYYNPDPQKAHFFSTGNFALPAKIFDTVSGFDHSLITGEDREFCDRLHDYGYSMRYAPEVVVYHAHTLTLRSFWLQHFNYGQGAFIFRSVRARRCQRMINLECLSFYLKLIFYPLWSGIGTKPVRYANLLLISQVANLLGFFKQWINPVMRAPIELLTASWQRKRFKAKISS